MLADGTRITVAANASTAAEARAAAEHGAEGVGLLRTEVAFLNRDDLPSEDEQVAAITGVCAELGDRLVIVRTLDAGGDKPIPALGLDPVRNGFLGVRGVRHSLANPALFRTQLRAILRAAADHRVAVMFPMVTDVSEVRAAKAALEDARSSLAADRLAHGEAEEVGVMVEVPVAALAADELAAEVDFFSIGSNDLVQYVMAADRTLGEVASLYRPERPAVLRLIATVCSAAAGAGRWVGVCGEMAGDPGLAVLLVGLGVRELSMAPAAIPAVKRRLRATTLAQAQSSAQSSR
jgi:phosphoenolpyruvate-protein kinase (PTS system EI component)